MVTVLYSLRIELPRALGLTHVVVAEPKDEDDLLQQVGLADAQRVGCLVLGGPGLVGM